MGLAVRFRSVRAQGACCATYGIEGRPVPDFENGTDLILFDDLSHVRADRAIPVREPR